MTDLRLIDANALLCDVMGLTIATPAAMNYANAINMAIADAPTIDSVPVVHGRWEYIPPRVMEFQDRPVLVHGSDKIICTACEGKAFSADWLKFSYCPNCGAKMDGGASDGN